MDTVRRCAVLAVVIMCSCFIVPWSEAPAVNRPDGQAIQFGIGSSFNLSNFDGATIAYQRFLRPDLAWRLSVGADLLHDSGDMSERRTGEHGFDESTDFSEWNHEISLASEWLAYRGDQVAVFFGGGPRISYLSRRDEYSYYSMEAWHLRRSDSESFGAGFQGALGIQWAAADWLALHAEYGARCTYSHEVREQVQWTEGEDEDYHRETTTFDRLFLDSRGVRFGLSAYF